MVKSISYLLFAFYLVMAFSTQTARAAENVFLEGDKGHFVLEPGKVYYWKWTAVEAERTKTGLPEISAGSNKPSMVKSTPAESKPATETKTVKGAATETGPIKTITKEAILKMTTEIEEAANNKDIDSVAHYLSPDVIVFLTIDTPAGRQDLRLNKEDYVKMVKAGFSKIPAYSYRSENVDINISKDGKTATIEEDIHETIGSREMQTEVVSHQKQAVELSDGKIVVTKIVVTEK